MKKRNRKERRLEQFGKKNVKTTKATPVVEKKIEKPVVTINPLNEKQDDYYMSLLGDPCVICTGAAGTGKTYLAASVAAKDLADGRINRIILSRANVSTGKSIGALPGTVEEKMLPWLMPMLDVLKSQLGTDYFNNAMKTKTIEVQPIETIRGRSFDDTIVLMDEAQQLTKEELKAITTRIGENSKLYLMGDRAQRDVRTDGLKWLLDLVCKHNLPVAYHTFTSDDIVRSGLCKMFVKAYEKEDD